MWKLNGVYKANEKIKKGIEREWVREERGTKGVIERKECVKITNHFVQVVTKALVYKNLWHLILITGTHNI